MNGLRRKEDAMKILAGIVSFFIYCFKNHLGFKNLNLCLVITSFYICGQPETGCSYFPQL